MDEDKTNKPLGIKIKPYGFFVLPIIYSNTKKKEVVNNG